MYLENMSSFNEEEEDPDPTWCGEYGGLGNDTYRAEEHNAIKALDFYRHPHFDCFHGEDDPDPDCEHCRENGLAGKVLH